MDSRRAGHGKRQPQGAFAPREASMSTGNRLAIDSLTLDPDNARKHTEYDIGLLAKSLEAFGQQTPIVVTPDMTVVKGNGTVMAAMQLGWTELDAIETSLTGDALRAYSIADNKTGLNAEWDEERLVQQLQDFDDESLLESLGFDSEEMAELLGNDMESEASDDGELIEIRDFGMVWLLIGVSSDRGLELTEVTEFARNKLGPNAFMETCLGNQKDR